MLCSQIFEIEFLMDLNALNPSKSPESENHIFSGWPMRVCVSVTSITQKQVVAKLQIWYSTFVSYVDAT